MFYTLMSVWQLSELFYKKLKDEKEVEYWCPECEAGPFPNKRSLNGHILKAHKYYKRKESPSTEDTSEKVNGFALKK